MQKNLELLQKVEILKYVRALAWNKTNIPLIHDVNMKQDLKTQLLKLLHNPCLNEKVP